MNKVYTQDEFEQLDREVILTSTQADYTYFAIKLPKRKRLLVYFQIHLMENIIILMIV